MCLEAQMPSRMLTQQQSNVPTLTTAAINEPTSSRSRFAQATNLQQFSISVQNVAISGKKIDICHKSLSCEINLLKTLYFYNAHFADFLHPYLC